MFSAENSDWNGYEQRSEGYDFIQTVSLLCLLPDDDEADGRNNGSGEIR
jgi:hypothetical protein